MGANGRVREKPLRRNRHLPRCLTAAMRYLSIVRAEPERLPRGNVNRSPLDRLFALLLAVLFLGSTAGDGLGLDPCPHHAPAAAHGSAPSHGSAGVGAAAHAHHAPSSPSAPAPDGPADHSGACTCIGGCVAGTGAALAAPPPVAFRAHLVAHVAAGPAAASDFVPRLPSHFLPYALAPPRHG